jgi:hypothetical protein
MALWVESFFLLELFTCFVFNGVQETQRLVFASLCLKTIGKRRSPLKRLKKTINPRKTKASATAVKEIGIKLCIAVS